MVSGLDVAGLAAHANAARLYQGRGAQIIEGSTLTESTTIAMTISAKACTVRKQVEPQHRRL